MTTYPIDQRVASSDNGMKQGDQYIESEQPANNRYGQNGYAGASSALPGEHICSGFLPECKVSKDFRSESDWQTRTVSSAPLAAAHGHKPRANGGTVPANSRPVTKGTSK